MSEMKITKFHLHTEAGDKINGNTYIDREVLLAAVTKAYGDDCYFGIAEGTIIDENEELVATFSEN